MSALIGALRVSLSLETAAFEKGADLAQRQAAALGKKMEKLGNKLTSIGKGMTLGVTAPLGAFGVAAFNAAKDAEELQSAFNETFGALATEMNRWAEATGNAMGRSTREIQEGANAFGLYFNQAAKTRQEAARLSQQFTVLAQDLASFHNTSVDEALVALRSGLSGETEPMRRFGVFLNEAAVKAKALEMGLEPLNGKLTDQQKIIARSALIMEQTASAQGDVQRTSESTANQLRRSAAAWEELQITVGTKLLPVLTPLIEKLGAALEWFTSLPAPVQNTALALAAVAAVAGPLLLTIGALMKLFAGVRILTLFAAGLTGVGAASGVAATGATAAGIAVRALLGPIGLAITAITAIYLAWKNWDKISAIVQRVYNAVKTWIGDKLAAIWESAKSKIQSVGDKFKWLWDVVVGHSYVPDMVDGIAKEIARLDAVMVQPIEDATNAAAAAFRGLQERLRGLLASLYPEADRQNSLAADIRDLEEAAKAGIISVGQLNDALGRLALQENADALANGALAAIGTASPGALTQTANDIGVAVERARTPLQWLMDNLPTTAERMRFALEDAAVRGLQGIQEGLLDIIDGTKSVGEAFRDMAQGILRDLIRIGIQRAIIGPIANALFGGFGGARATGGPVMSGKSYLVGERGPELFTPGSSGSITPNHQLAMAGAPVTINVNGAMSDRDARRTGSQVYASWAAEQARARSKGIG